MKLRPAILRANEVSRWDRTYHFWGQVPALLGLSRGWAFSASNPVKWVDWPGFQIGVAGFGLSQGVFGAAGQVLDLPRPSPSAGVLGQSGVNPPVAATQFPAGVFGLSSLGGTGVFGQTGDAPPNAASFNVGFTTAGVIGSSRDQPGVEGFSTQNFGVVGESIVNSGVIGHSVSGAGL
jgi:hypothetical protein